MSDQCILAKFISRFEKLYRLEFIPEPTSVQSIAREMSNYAKDLVNRLDSEELLSLFEAYLILNGFSMHAKWEMIEAENSQVYITSLYGGENSAIINPAIGVFFAKQISLVRVPYAIDKRLKEGIQIIAFSETDLRLIASPHWTIIRKLDLSQLISVSLFKVYLENHPTIFSYPMMRNALLAIVNRDIGVSEDYFEVIGERLLQLLPECK